MRGTLAGHRGARSAAENIERTALVMVGRALTAENFQSDSALYDADYRRRFRGEASLVMPQPRT